MEEGRKGGKLRDGGRKLREKVIQEKRESIKETKAEKMK